MIRLQNLTIHRDGTPVTDGVSLDFGAGGITALIGPNGAGKSTLLHAIAGLIPPAAGSVTVEGLDMTRARPAERARLVALLLQSEHVTARLTVRDLVAFGRWPIHRGRPGPTDRDRTEEALVAFNLGDLGDRVLDTLSGGQRQRAFVAMTWAQETPWMLLDEPLSALDPRHVRDIMERLHRLSRPGPGARSVIVVLHDLAVAARYADRIVALKAGRLVAAGDRPLTMTAALLSDLFETPLGLVRVGSQDVVIAADESEKVVGNDRR